MVGVLAPSKALNRAAQFGNPIRKKINSYTRRKQSKKNLFVTPDLGSLSQAQEILYQNSGIQSIKCIKFKLNGTRCQYYKRVNENSYFHIGTYSVFPHIDSLTEGDPFEEKNLRFTYIVCLFHSPRV